MPPVPYYDSSHRLPPSLPPVAPLLSSCDDPTARGVGNECNTNNGGHPPPLPTPPPGNDYDSYSSSSSSIGVDGMGCDAGERDCKAQRSTGHDVDDLKAPGDVVVGGHTHHPSLSPTATTPILSQVTYTQSEVEFIVSDLEEKHRSELVHIERKHSEAVARLSADKEDLHMFNEVLKTKIDARDSTIAVISAENDELCASNCRGRRDANHTTFLKSILSTEIVELYAIVDALKANITFLNVTIADVLSENDVLRDSFQQLGVRTRGFQLENRDLLSITGSHVHERREREDRSSQMSASIIGRLTFALERATMENQQLQEEMVRAVNEEKQKSKRLFSSCVKKEKIIKKFRERLNRYHDEKEELYTQNGALQRDLNMLYDKYTLLYGEFVFLTNISVSNFTRHTEMERLLQQQRSELVELRETSKKVEDELTIAKSITIVTLRQQLHHTEEELGRRMCDDHLPHDYQSPSNANTLK